MVHAKLMLMHVITMQVVQKLMTQIRMCHLTRVDRGQAQSSRGLSCWHCSRGSR